MTQTTHPTKEAVRELMARPRETPLTPEQIQRELGWHLIKAEQEAAERQAIKLPR
jgi:hypothetical protein